MRGFMMGRLALLAMAVLLPSLGQAATSTVATTARGSARLITDMDEYAPGQTLHVALEITPAPGWHTYWHNPGDAGAPPEFDLSAPGAAVGGIAWPLPDRIADGPVMSFGYARQVLFTRDVTPTGTGALTLTAQAHWLICATLCVPQQADFQIVLPQGTPSASAQAPAIAAALASVPRAADFQARIGPDGTLSVAGVTASGPAVFLPDAGDTTVLGAAQTMTRDGDHLTLKLTPTAAFQPSAAMTGVLVVGEGDARRGWRISAAPGLAASQAPPAPRSVWSPLNLLLAFAGGLILNLMPCVFPILAMKAVSLAGYGGRAPREVRLQAAAYTAGVLASFAAVAIVFAAIRAAGSAAGWGFQFQMPGFVGAMAFLFFAIGLVMSGVYAPGGRLMGAGQGLAARGGLSGSFATGLLAVLVATPCTAPFMGAAIAAAAAAPILESLAIFLALGLGFSLPWTLLALRPRLAALMPAPGAWMETLRQALAFPMYAAAVWMVWVLSQESGSPGVLAAGGGLLLIGFGLWALRLGAASGRRAGAVLGLAALLGAVAILPSLRLAPSVSAGSAERYTPERLAALRGAGQPVLVNMTAAWCVTCLVNERAAIRPSLPGLKARHVAYLVGDWTRQDPDITSFLRQYGRDGVPLYVFFAPNAPPRLLPQILTTAMLAALE